MQGIAVRAACACAVVGSALLLFAGAAAAADFAPAVDHYVGGEIYDVAAGDLNGDGRLDVATVAQNLNRASTLLNAGAAAFEAPDDWATADRPYALALADLNRDGRLDLAVASLGSNSISVYRGVGDGRFSSPSSFATGDAPSDVEAADLDGDGVLDLAVVNNGWPSSSISVLLGRGDGTFRPAIDAAVGGDYPQQLRFGDLNRDGRLDLFVSVANADAVAVLLGQGGGRFSAPALYRPPLAGGWSPTGITTGDFNGDGIVDVATTNMDRLWAWPGRADGTLGPPTTALTYPGGRLGAARDILAADFDGDGSTDLAVANQGSTNNAPSDVTVMHGRGDGTFGDPAPYAIPPTTDTTASREYGAGANSLAVGDFDGDRRPDLAVGHMLVGADPGGIAVLLNASSWDPAGAAGSTPTNGTPAGAPANPAPAPALTPATSAAGRTQPAANPSVPPTLVRSTRRARRHGAKHRRSARRHAPRRRHRRAHAKRRQRRVPATYADWHRG